MYLSNGVKVEFDKVGNWIEVEVKHTAIMPETVVPVNVMTYVKTHYSTYKIVSIEKERDTFQIELVKGNQEVELLFDKEGNFLRIE
ncbi:PepSY-like domain-containing protein [Myroides marinus]|uniref:PepSY-like domain-containing protein n=1 Tax=Myroides marinus TaxID=703342 RepID=UPI002577C8B2|nr:PepSY-like domain-containing protein [Myroides marinus]MDM1405683.1 PepSY-like domain-containing protein [Myroides marinus]